MSADSSLRCACHSEPREEWRIDGDTKETKTLKKTHIVGIGIACMDYIYVAPAAKPGGFSPVVDYMVQGGGLTGTALVACARLGADAKMLGRIGDDQVGQQIAQGLEEEGVDTSDLLRVPGGKSYFSMILVDADTAERTIFGRMDVGLDCSTDLIPLSSLDSADAVVLDPHWADGARVVAKRARELGVPIVLDMIVKPEVVDVLAMADYPIIPRNSAFKFAGCEDYSAALAKIRSLGCKAAIITGGLEGAFYSGESGEGHVDAFPVEAVDTTGAGDTFHGAFAFGLSQGWGIRDAVTFSSAVSAIKCTKVGGRTGIPTFEQTMTFLEERGVRVPSCAC